MEENKNSVHTFSVQPAIKWTNHFVAGFFAVTSGVVFNCKKKFDLADLSVEEKQKRFLLFKGKKKKEYISSTYFKTQLNITCFVPDCFCKKKGLDRLQHTSRLLYKATLI